MAAALSLLIVNTALHNRLEMAELSRSNGWGGRREGAGRPRSRRDAVSREFFDRVAYIRYLGAAAAKALATATPSDWVLHSRELQTTLDNVLDLLGSALDGDQRPFSDREYQDWVDARHQAATSTEPARSVD